MWLVLTQKLLTSDYKDDVGKVYHFPNMYRSQINSGDRFIYYHPATEREDPHYYYFGVGEIGSITPDSEDANNWYAEIVGYVKFPRKVDQKDEKGNYLEIRPGIKHPPFIRSIRAINLEIYCRILKRSGLEGQWTQNCV